MSKEQDFANWLNTCHGISNARPVKIRLGPQIICLGAICEHRRPFEATERAVQEKVVTAGEIHLTYRLYGLGTMPKRYAGNMIFVWRHNMPYDPRVEYSIGEWYRAGYVDKITPETEVFHPFGKFFFLHEAAPMSYGPYKDHKLDHFERRPYDRVEMTVTETPT